MCIVVGCKIVLDNVIIKPAQTLSTQSNGPDSGHCIQGSIYRSHIIYLTEQSITVRVKSWNVKQTVFFAETNMFVLVFVRRVYVRLPK